MSSAFSRVSRWAAIAVVALLPLSCTAASPRLAEVPDGVAGPLRGAGGGSALARTDLAPGSHVDDRPAVDERLWLRSVSTAPMRPRLSSSLPAADAPRDLLTRNARLRVDDPSPGALEAITAQPGVAFATAAHLGEVPVRWEEGRERLSFAFVHPGGYRVFTPRVTGTAEPLWRALADGDVALTFAAGRRLDIDPGSDLRVGPLGRRVDTSVAAWHSGGRGELADVVAGTALMRELNVDTKPVILVSVRRLADIGPVERALTAVGVGAVSRVPDIEPYRAEIVGDDPETVAAIEPFAFTHRGGGMLNVDQAWRDRNIVTTQVPILGEVKCHRLMVPQLRAALTEIAQAGLSDLVHAHDYGGCFFPRHIGWDETRSLSMHAWGLALDFNVQTNLMGQRPQMDLRVVEIFERHGFNWGGRWRVPDGMHFELGVLDADA